MSYAHLPPPDEKSAARLRELLELCVAERASDLHLTAGELPRLRRDGQLTELEGAEALSSLDTARLASAACDGGQRASFDRSPSLDLALSLESGERFRINLFRERGEIALAIRLLEERIRTLAELGLPERLGELADFEEGLVLFVGPTGSGKSTSLATLIERINERRAVHVLTLEDPIEYIHRSRRALVRQRQLHSDFGDFAEALRAALREDPDVILVGEMRDRATLRAALTAAETGHLVFSTLHAANSVSASERFVGAFADHERDSVRHQLSYVLKAVVAQRLLPGRQGGRVPAVELLKVTPAVANLIRSGRPAQVLSALESGSRLGMQSFEESLADLVLRERVYEGSALRLARSPTQLRERLGAGRGWS